MIRGLVAAAVLATTLAEPAGADMTPEPVAVGAGASRLRRDLARLQGGKRIAAHRLRQCGGKGGAVGERLGEQAMIAPAGDFDSAELREVWGQKLGVEEQVAAKPQARG